jgi:hypothetical protein
VVTVDLGLVCRPGEPSSSTEALAAWLRKLAKRSA